MGSLLEVDTILGVEDNPLAVVGKVPEEHTELVLVGKVLAADIQAGGMAAEVPGTAWLNKVEVH